MCLGTTDILEVALVTFTITPNLALTTDSLPVPATEDATGLYSFKILESMDKTSTRASKIDH